MLYAGREVLKDGMDGWVEDRQLGCRMSLEMYLL
jgi:hypothetical protein